MKAFVKNNTWKEAKISLKNGTYNEVALAYKDKDKDYSAVIGTIKAHKDVKWTKEVLLQCQTRQDYYDLIHRSFPNEIDECYVLNSETYSLHDTYGLECRYGECYLSSGNPNNYTNYIFKTKLIPLPKRISWTVRYQTSSVSSVCVFAFHIRNTDMSLYKSLFKYEDGHSTNNNTSSDGGYIAGKKVVSNPTSSGYTWTASLDISTIYDSFNLDPNEKYILSLINTYKYNSYSSNTFYITSLEINW